MTAAATRWPPKYRCSTRGLLAVLPLERVEHDPRFDPHAGCGLGNCWLFDARERGETVEDFADRRVAAGRVWSACPVRVSCVAWGI
ncbi:MAG: hypothetical protein ABI140_05725, partial [Jatrophihabitantaceae bacterium]